ncbi:MAG: PleD family two-component system response regulator [Desulfonatronovibrio sp.]
MSGKILVVDDEVHVRMLLEQTLEDLVEDYGLEIITSGDGLEALELIRSAVPDLVFLDVMMPQMNGYEVCKAVSKEPELQDVKIVLLTAKGQDVDRRQGLEMGAFKFMTKPFDPDEVLEMSKRFLNLG